MAKQVDEIKIFSSVGMPEKAGEMFLELKGHRDADVMKYKVGELASDMIDEDASETVGPLEMDRWLKSLGAIHGETVILHHGWFDWE